MSGALSHKGREEREAMIAEIHAAFGGVTRGENGISWNECVEIDHHGSGTACKAARQSDRDVHWNELIADPDWEPFPGIGGFCFINCEGFRYYLPPTMIRFSSGDNSEWYPGHLLSTIERFTLPHLLKFWSQAQLRCIARFIYFMAHHDDSRCPCEPNLWKEALTQRWAACLQV